MAAPDELPVCFRVMSQADAVEISGWHYQAPYDFYDATADADDLAELLDPELRAGNYLAAVDRGGAVVGFAQLVAEGGTVDVGLGLRPDLTGRGLGAAFLESVLSEARSRHAPKRFTLSVAAFNRRAITVYERAGFVTVRRHQHATNGGVHEFVTMARTGAAERDPRWSSRTWDR
jgi:[ribosomal protein S18]-alanine N-acetyltransferase